MWRHEAQWRKNILLLSMKKLLISMAGSAGQTKAAAAEAAAFEARGGDGRQ